MKALLLNPPFLPKFSRPQRSPAVTKSGTLYYPIWLAYATGVLEQDWVAATLLDAPARGFSLTDTVSYAASMKPDLVVMDTSTPSIQNDMLVAMKLRDAIPDCFIVMVGTHVSALAEETLLTCDAIDAVARREYEYTIRDLSRVLRQNRVDRNRNDGLQGIGGLSYRMNGHVVHNPDRVYIAHLDNLPWVSTVYQKHLNIRDYFNPNALYPMVTLITSRGCPFRCSFCLYPQTLTGRRYRFRSIADVLDEIEFVVRTFPDAQSIFFEDDTLTANKQRCLQFADGIVQRGIRIPWTANSRIEVDLETMIRIRAAGCRQLCVGFESGSQQVLDSMKKGIQIERMQRFMRDARQAGILIHGCFMVGFPGETAESVQQTIDLAIRLKPDTVQFYPVMVYPGTEAYDSYLRKGWITSRDYRDWVTTEGLHNCVVRNEFLTSRDLVRLCDLARRRFYLRPGYILYKLRQMLERPSEVIRTVKAARTFCRHLLVGSRV
ncbi:B12-binding domain-containing radical SAM protein [Desulfatirhabdium butyrativorans]|uniref:B12-binding domain-containing radical SAM protein n=1 Tax=Desulfatirhabdium butyrativorans TaxID=340467 RepID=UPI0003FD2805|nr:radical SAM protein [Desulfatirhabdium butyrativorans]